MPTEPLSSIDQLIESKDFPAARRALGAHDASDPAVEVLSLKLSLTEGTMSPHVCMQKLIDILRRVPDAPGGKELYQTASSVAYQTHSSTYSHSHPPPPVGPDDDTD